MSLTEDTISTVQIKIPDTTTEDDIARYMMVFPDEVINRKKTKLDIITEYYDELRQQYGKDFLTRKEIINKIKDKMSISLNTASVYYYKLKNAGETV